MTSPANRWAFLLVISLGLLMIGVDNSILYTALPALREQLALTESQALWVINAYPLILAGLLLGTGSLGDRIGHRRMFLTGLGIFGAASLMAAFAPTAGTLIAARGLLGLGAAVMMPATLALVATWLIAPANQPNPVKHWDAPSSLMALLALAGLVGGIKEAANTARSPWLLAACALAFGLGTWAFASRQRRLADPLLDASIFRSRIFTGGVLSAGGVMFAVAGLELMTTQRFQLVAGYSPLQAGMLVIVVTLMAFPASILGGAFLHRVGFGPLIAGGFAPVRRAGMAAGVEEVSYEFGTLLAVAVLGSLLPVLHGGGALAHLTDPAAYDHAYQSILVIIAAVAAGFAAITAWCFRDNPKGARLAQQPA